jgi:hypothetical protein
MDLDNIVENCYEGEIFITGKEMKIGTRGWVQVNWNAPSPYDSRLNGEVYVQKEIGRLNILKNDCNYREGDGWSNLGFSNIIVRIER